MQTKALREESEASARCVRNERKAGTPGSRQRSIWLAVGVALSCASLSLPAAAADPSLSHLAHLMAEAAVGENAPELPDDFTANISANTLPLQFEKTQLAEIQAAFGGSVQTSQEAIGQVSWLCYTRQATPAQRVPVTVWFISSAAPPSLVLNMVVAQAVDAEKHDGCSPAPSGFALPAVGLPPLGAAAADMKARFGSLPYDKVRNLYYNSTRPAGDGSGKSVYQRLGYAMKRGRAVGIAISQSTN